MLEERSRGERMKVWSFVEEGGLGLYTRKAVGTNAAGGSM